MSTNTSDTGFYNTGINNSGNCNAGDCNTGHGNVGNCNTGDYNIGNWNTGYFCVQDGPVMFFDLPCSLTRQEAEKLIPHIGLPVDLPFKQAFAQAWGGLSLYTKKKFLELPNFDPVKFQQITSVDVTKDTDLFPKKTSEHKEHKRIVIDGEEFELVPVKK